MSSCFEPKNREDGRVFSLNNLCFQLKLPLIDLTWTSFWCICIKIEILETHTQKKHVLNEFQIMQSVNIDLIFQKLAN